MRIGRYRLHVAWHAWEWGRDLYPFSGAVFIHRGPFHFFRPATEADWLA